MKGYKVFNPNWTCRDFQYKVGKTYKHEGEIELCEKWISLLRRVGKLFWILSF